MPIKQMLFTTFLFCFLSSHAMADEFVMNVELFSIGPQKHPGVPEVAKSRGSSKLEMRWEIRSDKNDLYLKLTGIKMIKNKYTTVMIKNDEGKVVPYSTANEDKERVNTIAQGVGKVTVKISREIKGKSLRVSGVTFSLNNHDYKSSSLVDLSPFHKKGINKKEAETVVFATGFLGALVFDYQGSIDIGKEFQVKNGNEDDLVFVGMTSLDNVKDFTLANTNKQTFCSLSNERQQVLGNASESLNFYQSQNLTYRTFMNDELEITEGIVRITLFPSKLNKVEK